MGNEPPSMRGTNGNSKNSTGKKKRKTRTSLLRNLSNNYRSVLPHSPRLHEHENEADEDSTNPKKLYMVEKKTGEQTNLDTSTRKKMEPLVVSTIDKDTKRSRQNRNYSTSLHASVTQSSIEVKRPVTPLPSTPYSAGLGLNHLSLSAAALTTTNTTISTVSTAANTDVPSDNRVPNIPTIANVLSQRTYLQSVSVLQSFWKDHIETLDKNEKTVVSMLILTHMYREHPNVRSLMLSGSTRDTALKFLNMIKWLIETSAQCNVGDLEERLFKLGRKHYRLGVAPQWYSAFLIAVHSAFQEFFDIEIYTIQRRYSMDELIKFANEVMTQASASRFTLNGDSPVSGRISLQAQRAVEYEQEEKKREHSPMDTHSRGNKRGNKRGNSDMLSVKCGDLPVYLLSLRNCLQDDTAILYLHMFCQQKNCEQFIDFHKAYLMYNGSISQFERNRLGATIMSTYFNQNSGLYIAFNSNVRMSINRKLQKNSGDFSAHIFASAYEQILSILENDIWQSFVRTMLQLL